MKTRIIVRGEKNLGNALKELATATNSRTATAAVRRGLLDAGQPMAERMRSLVRKRSGALEKSITVSARLKNPAGAAAYRATLQSGGSKSQAVQAKRDAQRAAKGASVEVYVGPSGAAASRAHLLEKGTARSRAFPFVAPAAAETAPEVAQGIRDCVSDRVEKAIVRAKRRAAKRKGG